MPRTIRQRISHVLQTTFRLSSPKSKITSSCCSVKKSNDYEYVSYAQKSTNSDYIDLSECYSSYSKDSGISVNSNEHSHPLQSTKIYSDDSSISTISDLSYIAHNVTKQQSTIECCRCQCHHYINNKHLYTPAKHEQIKRKIYPFIF